MSGPVSVSENRQLQQNISWQPPVSSDVSMYLVRYGMGDSNMENVTSITTSNTSIVLTLPVPDGPPNMVVYNIWVAVVTEFKEQGSFEKLMIQYKRKLFIIIYRCAYAWISSYKEQGNATVLTIKYSSYNL